MLAEHVYVWLGEFDTADRIKVALDVILFINK